MVRNHLTRIAAPKTWHILRKENVWITRPNPGAHKLGFGMSLSTVMRRLLGVAANAKEAKKIIHTRDVFVDKLKRKDDKYCTGFMDVIEFPQAEKQFRILLDRKGRLTSEEITEKENNLKLCRIEGKTKASGKKTQLRTMDGRSLLIDKDTYKVGDTILIDLPKQVIKDHFKLDKNKSVVLTGGKHAGAIGKIDDISGTKLIFKTGSKKFETLKKYAFVIGNDKPALKCLEAK